jgi:hypothetical protein
MAYEGGIEYMDVPYVKVDWAKDIVSPFNGTKLSEPHDPMVVTHLKAPIYDLVDSQSANLILDETDHNIKRHHLKCIIVGTSKLPQPKDQALCYVLLVQEAVGQDPSIYERAGVARLKRNQIAFNLSNPLISIQ